MILTVIGSNSKGNCYALQSDSETLVLEAGCSLASFKKVLRYNYRPIVGICVSHVHGDHAKYVKEFMRTGAPLCSNTEVLNKYGSPGYDIELSEGETRSIGNFRVTPFVVFHDVKCYAYLIYHKDMGTLLFATDTFALPNTFVGVDHWLLEANYSDEIISGKKERGELDKTQYNRILTSHMSLENCIKNLQDGHAECSRTITLCHLSERHSDPVGFKEKVASTFGVITNVAQKGISVNLTKENYEVQNQNPSSPR